MASFELPITSISNTKMLNKEVVDDLELLTSCKEILYPTTMFGEKTVCLWTRNYTSNVEHLKDTQALLRRNIPIIHKSHINEVSNVSNVWNQIVSMNTDTDTDNGTTNVNDMIKEKIFVYFVSINKETDMEKKNYLENYFVRKLGLERVIEPPRTE